MKLTVDTDGAHGEMTGTIVATAAHPFWAPEKEQWLAASAVQVGERLRDESGASVDVLAVGGYRQRQKVHNLTVAGIRTYYVLVGPIPVLVHNSDCGRDLIEGGDQVHIIAGDAHGGGHKWPGQPGKTPFPPSWDTDDILDGIADVVTNSESSWQWQTGAAGSMYTHAGNPSRVKIIGEYNGLQIRVIYEPATGRVVTGFTHT